MDVRLAGVLALEVLVRHVLVVQRRVVVVVLLRSAEVLESPGHLVVVVRHVEVPVSMHQPLVVMFFTPGRGRSRSWQPPPGTAAGNRAADYLLPQPDRAMRNSVCARGAEVSRYRRRPPAHR